MKFKLFQVAVVFTFLFAGCAASKNKSATTNSLPATELHPFGRTFIDNNEKLQLISSAVHVGFSFKGDSCSIYASLNNLGAHNYLQYELDGVYQKRIRIGGKDTSPIVIKATSKGKHTVWLYKATEAHTGNIGIEKIIGNNITALSVKPAPIIEFIGNSITCGAASDPSEIPCGSGQYHDQHNAYMAYGPGVARALETNYLLSSVSGIGVYRNWNSDGPTMPQVYEKVDFQENNLQFWNFDTYKPKIVSIALGTNDFSKGDGKKPRLPFDSTAFIGNYVQFIQIVRSKYPGAQIALLSSPMVTGNARVILQNCLNTVKQKVDEMYPAQKPLNLFFFDPMQAHGCGGHPNVEDHAIMAKQLTPFFKTLLSQ
ncbi:MAG: GDSL-type esterase/lipase family protein [Bacteroidota bacterium]